MVEKDISVAEMARRKGCTDAQVLAQIERAEYIVELAHSFCGWVSRKTSAVAHDISALLHRHAH